MLVALPALLFWLWLLPASAECNELVCTPAATAASGPKRLEYLSGTSSVRVQSNVTLSQNALILSSVVITDGKSRNDMVID